MSSMEFWPAGIFYWKVFPGWGKQGFCTSVSAPGRTIDNVPLAQMYMKGITFDISRVHARNEIEKVLDCACHGKIHHQEVISTHVPFSQAQDVMTDPDIKIVFEAD